MKKLFLVFSLVFMVFVVAACKKDETTTKPKTTTEQTTEDRFPGYELATYKPINMKFYPTNVRNTFFQAAEKYLLENMYGGIPVFSNSGYNLYHDRVDLPVDEYVPGMGFGTEFATLTEDDSTIEFSTGETPVAGEKTFRTALGQNPTTFHQWLYDDSTSSDVITYFLDAPYVYRFNSEGKGYALKPGMAKGYPYALVKDEDDKEEWVEPELTEDGTLADDAELLISTKWRIDIKEGLKWTYHDDTIQKYGDLDTEINAEDFVKTYKLALEEGWFRAISGGGDFFSTSHRIVNAEEFYEGKVGFEDVGIKLVAPEEGNAGTIQFEFTSPLSEWNVRYWLGSFVMGPISFPLYNKLAEGLTENDTIPYGTSVETTAYNGAFKLENYEPDKVVRYQINENFREDEKDLYDLTGWHYAIIPDSEVRYQEFLKGNLDVASLPSTAVTFDKDKNVSNRGAKFVPGTTTFRIMINGLGTEENLHDLFPDTTWEPKPLLANQNFKRAMFLAIDRQTLAKDIMKTSTPQMYHFTDAYLVDALTGIPFRNADEGKPEHYSKFSPETFGFAKDTAIEWWAEAVKELIDEGVYSNGDKVELQFRVFSGSQSQTDMGDFIKQSFEETFTAENANNYFKNRKDNPIVDANYDLSVEVTVEPTAFPDIYYEFMMKGNFDLAIGGISGSSLDAASFLDVYCSDDRGGFTLNWGIDTTVAEIPVEYSYEGKTYKEVWSFDAIVEALNGTVTVVNGVEVSAPTISLGDGFKAKYSDEEGRSTINIPIGGTLDLTDVKVTDPHDAEADLTVTRTITKYNATDKEYEEATAIDFTKAGRYFVTSQVENTSGVKDSVSIYVNVMDPKPQFTLGSAYDNAFLVGDTYHLFVKKQFSMFNFSTITASDLKDGSLTGSIRPTKNFVIKGQGEEGADLTFFDKDDTLLYNDTNKDGKFTFGTDTFKANLNLSEVETHTIEFEVKNSNDKTATITIKLHVVEDIPGLDIVFDADKYDGITQDNNSIVNKVTVQKDFDFNAKHVTAEYVEETALDEFETELVKKIGDDDLVVIDEYEQVVYEPKAIDYTKDIEITYPSIDEITGEGFVDTSQVGTHIVIYKVTNIYGIETIEYLIVEVVE